MAKAKDNKLFGKRGPSEDERKKFEADQKFVADEKKRLASERNKLDEEQKKFTEAKKALADERKKLEDERKVLEADRKKLKPDQEALKKAQDKLDADRKTLEADRKKLDEDRKTLEADCKKLDEDRKTLEADCKKLDEDRKAFEASKAAGGSSKPGPALAAPSGDIVSKQLGRNFYVDVALQFPERPGSTSGCMRYADLTQYKDFIDTHVDLPSFAPVWVNGGGVIVGLLTEEEKKAVGWN